MIAVPYIRISSKNTAHWPAEQATQLHAITQWAAENRHTLTDPFVDAGVAGTSDPSTRTGWAALLVLIGGAPSEYVVVVTEGSRISRHSLYQEIAITGLQAQGVRVADVTEGLYDTVADESADMWFMRSVIQLTRELERRKIVERLARGKARVRSEGGNTGDFPAKVTADDCDRIITLHLAGETGRAIALETGLSTATISRCLAAARKRGDIL